jgi:hypothetical protein
MSTAWKFVGPGRHFGVPSRDITAEEFETLSPRQRRIITESPAYEELQLDDPLGELSNAEFDTLSPAEKGARTREANRRAEEAAAAAQAEADARAAATQATGDAAGSQDGE